MVDHNEENGDIEEGKRALSNETKIQDINRLVKMHFRREECIKWYEECEHDFDTTLIALITGKSPHTKPKPRPEPKAVQYQKYTTPTIPKKNPIIDVSALSAHRFGQFQPFVNSLTLKEKAILLRLLPLGPDDETTVQLFMACEKDETVTRHLLEEMGGAGD